MPASWGEFALAAPVLAAGAESLFARHEVVILGTTKERGAPRLALVEPRVISGRLTIGVELGDAKDGDLRRHPRCSIHTVVDHRTHTQPVFKADLAATPVDGNRTPGIVAALERPEIGWRPTAIFELNVVSATLIEGGAARTWRDR